MLVGLRRAVPRVAYSGTYNYTNLACRMRIAKAYALANSSRLGSPYYLTSKLRWSTLKTKLLTHSSAFTSFEEARLFQGLTTDDNC
jgi:hypothetical protein